MVVQNLGPMAEVERHRVMSELLVFLEAFIAEVLRAVNLVAHADEQTLLQTAVWLEPPEEDSVAWVQTKNSPAQRALWKCTCAGLLNSTEWRWRGLLWRHKLCCS